MISKNLKLDSVQKRKTRQMLGFKSFDTAKSTLSGIAIMHMVHKGQIEGIQDVLSEVRFISELKECSIRFDYNSDEFNLEYYLHQYRPEDVLEFADELNGLLRRRLGHSTPEELFEDFLVSIYTA